MPAIRTSTPNPSLEDAFNYFRHLSRCASQNGHSKPSIALVAREFDVNYHTLRQTICRRHVAHGRSEQQGRRLSNAEEKEVKDILLMLAAGGFPAGVPLLRQLIGYFLVAKGDHEPLGKHAHRKFLKRHPELNFVRSVCLEAVRALTYNTKNVTTFFDMVEKAFEEGDFDPSDRSQWHRIANLDETGHAATSGSRKIIIGKGDTREIVSATGRENTTTLSTILGDGTLLHPLVIFKAEQVHSSWMANDTLGCNFSAQSNGWIDEEIFAEHVSKTIIPSLRSRIGDVNIRGFLFIDGHATHYSPHVLRSALEHNIQLIVFPPHTSNWLQPLDLAVFTSHKHCWKEEIQLECELHGLTGNLPKSLWLVPFIQAYRRSHTPANIQAGFRKAGILPLNRAQHSPSNLARGDLLVGRSSSSISLGPDAALFGQLLPSAAEEQRPMENTPAAEDEEVLQLEGMIDVKLGIWSLSPPSTRAPSPEPRPAPSSSPSLSQLASNHPDVNMSSSPSLHTRAILDRLPKNFHSKHLSRTNLANYLDTICNAVIPLIDAAEASAAHDVGLKYLLEREQARAHAVAERTSRCKRSDAIVGNAGAVISAEEGLRLHAEQQRQKEDAEAEKERKKAEREAARVRRGEEAAAKKAATAEKRATAAAAKAAKAAAMVARKSKKSVSSAKQPSAAPFLVSTNTAAIPSRTTAASPSLLAHSACLAMTASALTAAIPSYPSTAFPHATSRTPSTAANQENRPSSLFNLMHPAIPPALPAAFAFPPSHLSAPAPPSARNSGSYTFSEPSGYSGGMQFHQDEAVDLPAASSTFWAEASLPYPFASGSSSL